jgi:hypothetical protein
MTDLPPPPKPNVEMVSISAGRTEEAWRQGPVIEIGGTNFILPLRLDHYVVKGDVNPKGLWGEHDISFNEFLDRFASPDAKVEWDDCGNVVGRLGLKTKSFKHGRFSGDLSFYPLSTPSEMQSHINFSLDFGRGYRLNGMWRHHESRFYPENKDVLGLDFCKNISRSTGFKAWYRRSPDGGNNFYTGFVYRPKKP